MKNIERQAWNRRIIVVAILMFVLAGNGMIFAKTEKPGATLVVQKMDGQTVRGELLEVKDGTLNLLVYKNATKIDIRLNELSRVLIEKKSVFLKSLGIGILVGAATGALLGFLSGDDKPEFLFSTARDKALVFGVLMGGCGGVIGGVAGALNGTEKLITFDRMSPGKMRLIEARLASLARYKPDPIAEFRKRHSKEPE